MTAKPAEVASLDPITMQTLCEEYIANNYIDPETSEKLGVKRGLRNPDGTGVLAGLTNVCDVVGYRKDEQGHVVPIPGKLIYRGVNINEIVDEAYRNDRFVFEEVVPGCCCSAVCRLKVSWMISATFWRNIVPCPMASWIP